MTRTYTFYPGCSSQSSSAHLDKSFRAILPKLGIEIDEKLAAKYPCDNSVVEWTKTRRPDGTPARP